MGKPKPKPDANSITRAVVTWLNTHGYVAWRQNNGGVFDSTAALKRVKRNLRGGGLTDGQMHGIVKSAMDKSWRPNGGIRGVPDVIGFRRCDGRWIGVEVKAGNDRLRPEQRDFLKALHRAGAEWYIARTSAQFIRDWCERNGATCPI